MSDMTHDRAWRDLRHDAEAATAVDELLFGQDSEPEAWPPDLRRAPVIIDTDIGGDPDDVVALIAAARACPNLVLVTTIDETVAPPSQRAQFAHWLLEHLGRAAVSVAPAPSHSEPVYFCIEDLVSPSEPAVGNAVEAVLELGRTTSGPLRWVGLGPMGTLATVIEQNPDLARRLHVTQMAGTLHHPDPTRSEYNLKADPAAAQAVLAATADGRLPTPRFVATDVTMHPALAIGPDHAWSTALQVSPGAWERVVAEHLRRWFDRFHPDTYMHDPLTLSAALGLPFVDSAPLRIAIDDQGRVHETPDGTRVLWSVGAHHEEFMTWLLDQLATSPAHGR